MLYAFDEYKHLQEFAGITACYNFKQQIRASTGTDFCTFNIPGVHNKDNLMVATSALEEGSSFELPTTTYFKISQGEDGISTDITVYFRWSGMSGGLWMTILANIYVLENL